jgi:hypothetical protein
VNALHQAALEIQAFLNQQEWQFCIIGGLAVIRWGEPRATQDVDISVMAGFGHEREYIDTVFASFPERISRAREFAEESRVLLSRASNGVALDIVLAAFPFEENVIQRASKFKYAPDVELLTASAEDLLVMKSFAGRDHDWVDATGIANRHGENLDWDCVFHEISLLCEMQKDNTPIERLQTIRESASEMHH